MYHKITVDLDGVAQSAKHAAQIETLLDVMSKSVLDRSDTNLVCILQDAIGRMTSSNVQTLFDRLDATAKERLIWVVSLVCHPSMLAFVVRATITTEEITQAANYLVADKLAMLDARLDAIIDREATLAKREANLHRSVAAAQRDLQSLARQINSLADNL